MEDTEALTRTNSLEQLRLRFELWRRNHPGRHRLPQELWSAAANLAQRYGVCRTAKALRLEYYSLKKHMQMGMAGEEESERRELARYYLLLHSSRELTETAYLLGCADANSFFRALHHWGRDLTRTLAGTPKELEPGDTKRQWAQSETGANV
jgi:hypothetical protein